jgi:hypothetical protein
MYVPDIYAIDHMDKNKNFNRTYDIIDGKQRLSIISSYIADEWALTKLKPIQSESTGEIHDISGKKFSELPEDVKEEINGYTLEFKIIELESNDDEESIIEDIFYRLNNGEPVSQEHLTLVKAKPNIKDFVRKIVTEHKLFKEIAYFTPSSIKKSGREMTIMQSILLVSGVEYKSFKNKDIKKVFLENEISEETLKATEKAFSDITKIFPEYFKQVSKINIPVLAYVLSKSPEGHKEQIFKLIQKYFKKDMRAGDKYKSYCMSSTATKNNINGRINTLKEICNINIQQAAK